MAGRLALLWVSVLAGFFVSLFLDGCATARCLDC